LNASDFLSRYPEFNSIDPDAAKTAAFCQQELDDADNMLSDHALGKARNLGLALVAAHRLSLRFKVSDSRFRGQNTPGVLAGQGASTGGVNQSLAHSALVTSGQAWRADYARTNYGLQYLGLLDRTISPAQIVGRAEDDNPPSGNLTAPWIFP
jgi:hypothetical protein